MATTRYAVQMRNPKLQRTYGTGTEFVDEETAIEQAKIAARDGLWARVVEIRRKVVWKSPTPTREET